MAHIFNDKSSLKTLSLPYMIAIWVVLMMTIMFGYGYWLDQQYNPNQPPSSKLLKTGAKQVILQLNRYDHFISAGRINGQEVNFLLDTGSTHVAISSALAEDLGLSFGPPTLTETANGTIKTFPTQLQALHIGLIELTNVSASINPHMNKTDEVLLGMSVLKRLRFSHEAGELTLVQPPRVQPPRAQPHS